MFLQLNFSKNIFTVAGYIQQLIKQSGLDLKVGLVQTAYANGSSTEYINKTLVIMLCVNSFKK